MADTHGSGPCARKGVEVQVLSPAPYEIIRAANENIGGPFCFSGWSGAEGLTRQREPDAGAKAEDAKQQPGRHAANGEILLP